MVHTNMAAYGFIANAFIAGMLFAIPRLTRQPILSDRLGWLIFGAWQLILVLTIGGQLAGYGQAIEWGETPIFVDPLVLVGLVLLVVNMSTPILRTREHGPLRQPLVLPRRLRVDRARLLHGQLPAAVLGAGHGGRGDHRASSSTTWSASSSRRSAGA